MEPNSKEMGSYLVGKAQEKVFAPIPLMTKNSAFFLYM
jgi:hypothetical protein